MQGRAQFLLVPLAAIFMTAAIPRGGLKNMISYEASSDKQDYIAGEQIRLLMRVENQGPETAELPDPQHPASDQPTIGLIGPGFPQGKLFSNLTALKVASGDESFVPPPAATVRIEPGQSWQGFSTLTRMAQVREPGEYRMRSSLAFQGQRKASEEKRFQVHAVDPSSIHLGLGSRPYKSASGEAVFIQKSQNSASVYVTRFNEDRPDIAEMSTNAPIHRATVSAGATDAVSPWRNDSFFGELLQWIVWREGRSIKSLSTVMSTPLSVELPAEPAYLVYPPLKTTGGPVEVLAVSPASDAVTLVEFSSSPVGENPSAKALWTERLPGTPAGITAALAPISQQSARHLALTVEKPLGFTVFHSRYNGSGRLEPFRQVAVETGRLLPAVPPALFVDGSGRVKVAVLTVSAENAHSCNLVEIEFGPSGDPVGNPRALNLALPGPPSAATILYSQNEGEPLRRDLVVAVQGHGLVHLDHTGHMIPVSVQGTPTSPILLAPGKEVTYVLYLDPKRGLYFEAL